MKNKLSDLNNHLFAQLERLGDEDMTPEQLKMEIGRARAMASIAESIVEGHKVTVDAVRLVAQHGQRLAPDLPMIEGRANG